jgi:hypothetical protein
LPEDLLSQNPSTRRSALYVARIRFTRLNPVHPVCVVEMTSFTTSSVLNASNRSYIESLMGEVESDQRWGISAAADDPSPSGSDYMLKNGWLPRRITQLWEINSIGEVQYHGQQYLVAVLSSNNKTMNSGISVVQQIAKAAVDSRA